jgi:hypothetical protein
LNRSNSIKRSNSQVSNKSEVFSTNIQDKDVELHEIKTKLGEAANANLNRSLRDAPKIEYSLLLDGSTVPVIFGDEELERMVRDVFEKAASVVVYRCSPGGKA